MHPAALLTVLRRRRDQAAHGISGGKVTLDLSPEALDLLTRLMEQTKDTPEDFFRKAFALYKAALDAHAEGKAVGVAPSPEALETEFVGF